MKTCRKRLKEKHTPQGTFESGLNNCIFNMRLPLRFVRLGMTNLAVCSQAVSAYQWVYTGEALASPHIVLHSPSYTCSYMSAFLRRGMNKGFAEVTGY